jgi:hypothetical protein
MWIHNTAFHTTWVKNKQNKKLKKSLNVLHTPQAAVAAQASKGGKYLQIGPIWVNLSLTLVSSIYREDSFLFAERIKTKT